MSLKGEETAPLKNKNINDLLEPLVQEETPRKKRLFESVIIPPKDYSNDKKHEIKFNMEENKIKKIRSELNDLDKETEDSSNYSNIRTIETLKCQNFLFIIILAIFSSLQFGIFLFIVNLYLKHININTNNNNNFTLNKLYILFLVLSWKYQIYFLFYSIYGLIVFFITKKSENNNSDKNEDSIPLIKNNSETLFDINPAYNFRKFKYKYLMKFGSSYSSYFTIFFYTSNIFNYPKEKNFFENFLNLIDILRGISGLIFSFTLFIASNFYYFGIVYLIQSITAMIPYYIKFNYNSKQNSNNNISKKNTKYFKYIFPILTSIGMYFLLKSIANNGMKNYLYLIVILLICILCQIYSQKQFVQKSYNESPFHILFKNYFIFFLLSNSIVLVLEIFFNLFNLRNLFFWLTDLYIFFACFIGFGILGSIYHLLLTMIRIALSNNVILKLIKYFNLFIIDLVGMFIFRQYNIFYKIDYFMGIALSAISLFILDFCDLL